MNLSKFVEERDNMPAGVVARRASLWARTSYVRLAKNQHENWLLGLAYSEFKRKFVDAQLKI